MNWPTSGTKYEGDGGGGGQKTHYLGGQFQSKMDTIIRATALTLTNIVLPLYKDKSFQPMCEKITSLNSTDKKQIFELQVTTECNNAVAH